MFWFQTNNIQFDIDTDLQLISEGKCDKLRTTPRHYRQARLAGEVIEHALESATIDVLMKCSPSFRANGSDQGKIERWEGWEKWENTYVTQGAKHKPPQLSWLRAPLWLSIGKGFCSSAPRWGSIIWQLWGLSWRPMLGVWRTRPHLLIVLSSLGRYRWPWSLVSTSWVHQWWHSQEGFR